MAAVGEIAALRDAAKARRLRRARSQGAPVRRDAGASWADLQAGLRGGPPHALRGGLDRGPHAGPAARLLSSACGRGAGSQIALVATARKLCVLFWHLLTPRTRTTPSGGRRSRATSCAGSSCMAGDPPRRGRRSGSPASQARAETHERELSEQAEARLPAAGRGLAAASRRKAVRARHRGAHLEGRQAAKQRGRLRSPRGLLFSSSSPAPKPNSPKGGYVRADLTFILRQPGGFEGLSSGVAAGVSQTCVRSRVEQAQSRVCPRRGTALTTCVLSA